MAGELPNGVPPDAGLAVYWNKQVSELAAVDVQPISAADAERHSIYSLVVMALIRGYWNGNKSGAVGHYPWREAQKIAPDRYAGDQFGDRYFGHNIACIAVDENGEIIDFEFNHNELYNSSAEHAEARLIRRLFSLNQIYDHWQAHASGETRPVKYGNVFNGITIYTSLESCAQCSGIMTLASCLRVVYLQSDPGQYLVGNLLYNLSRNYKPAAPAAALAYTRPTPAAKYWAPEPIDANLFGFNYKQDLDSAYQEYARTVDNKTRYFYKAPEGKPDASKSITSFLCTDLARDIYEAGTRQFKEMTAAHPEHRPARSDGLTDGVFSNAEALTHARAFVAHAVTEARRGTPHR